MFVMYTETDCDLCNNKFSFQLKCCSHYRSLITDTDGGVTSGQETQNEQTDNCSQADSLQSGASSDVEEGTNVDSKSRR